MANSQNATYFRVAGLSHQLYYELIPGDRHAAGAERHNMRLRESYSRSESEETQVSKRRFDVKKADSSNSLSLLPNKAYDTPYEP
jgi:hypothetical protein